MKSTAKSTNTHQKCTYKYNTYIVHYFTKTLEGTEHIPVRSSISDQCDFYANFHYIKICNYIYKYDNFKVILQDTI